MSEQPSGQVRVGRLAMLLRRKRQLEDLTLQEVAAQTGVSIATLSRLEKHSRSQVIGTAGITPDTKTVAALASWLSVPINDLLEDEAQPANASDVDLPLMVDTYLRANRNLKPDDAATLSKMFRDMFDNYTKQGSGKGTTEE